MTYDLIAIADDGSRRHVASFADYADAVAARGRDVLTQLAAHGGWWTRVEHAIVGPGVDGPRTEHGFCTELGVDPDRDRAPTAADIADAREWLEALHQPGGGRREGDASVAPTQ